MAIPSLLSSTPVGLVDVFARTSKLGFSKSVSVRKRVPPVRVGLRITACAAPCEVSVEKLGVGGIGLETSVLQCVKKGLVFHEGRSPDLIRAAAYLRALSFYTYPEGRSEEALKLHRKMKTDDEFSALTSKVAGLEQGYKRVVCTLALYPLACLDDRSIVDLHPALKVTVLNGEHVLVGSLDLNQGKVLPGEIVGDKPEDVNADRGRGYLSNVCVAPLMRQRGIGVALLQQAQKIAQLWGITSLYVHVVATNDAAVKLYHKFGFLLEKEESASDARRQARPRRSLLHKFI